MQNVEKTGGFAVDTTFVLFFLAIDLGQNFVNFGIDTFVSILTLGIVLVVPYFLPTGAGRPDFGRWVAERSLIAVFALGLGVLLSLSFGVVLPEVFRYLPMTLLIAAAVVSCTLHWCAMIKFRLAR